MKKHHTISAAALTAVLLVAADTQAASFLLNFTAGPFNPGSAPDDPVTGSFVYEAATSTSPITGINNVNLTINGNVYTLADVGFDVTGSESTIGALFNGVSSIAGGSNDDFRLDWNHTTQTASDFRYTTASTNALYTSASFSQFTVTAIPEPGTTGVALLIGLGAVAGRRMRRRRDEAVDETKPTDA